MRDAVVRDLAALMRGEVTPSQFTTDTKALCDQPPPSNDFLITSFWDTRLGPLPPDLGELKRLEVSRAEYEHLRRWIAILQTDVDWNVKRELPKYGCRQAAIVPITIAAMIAAGVLFDGVLIIVWVAIGLIVGPIAVIMAWRVPELNDRDPNPFASAEDRDSVIHLVEAAGVPPYDPARHGVSVATKVHRILPRVPILTIIGAFMCAIWPIVIWSWLHTDDADIIERVPLPQMKTALR